jgi:probable DNA metabolism protein
MEENRKGLSIMYENMGILVVFDSTFESLLSTALVCESIGGKTIHKDHFNPYMISKECKTIQTAKINDDAHVEFKEILKIYEKRKGCFRFSKYELNEIKKLVEWNLRYKKNDISKFGLVLKMIQECLVEGPSIVLSQVTVVSRETYKRSRQVGCEYHKACGFLRLDAIGDYLVSAARFEHDVEDLVVRFWSKRYPEKTVVLFSPSKLKSYAYIGNKGDVSFVEGEEIEILQAEINKKIRENPVHSIEEKDSNEDFNEIFEAFYDTSFIPSRRNKRLARRCVPKKYSDRFNMKEGIKIEYGMQKTKLDSFMCDESTNFKDKHKKKEIGKYAQS